MLEGAEMAEEFEPGDETAKEMESAEGIVVLKCQNSDGGIVNSRTVIPPRAVVSGRVLCGHPAHPPTVSDGAVPSWGVLESLSAKCRQMP